ncbi:MAG: NUDIX domain-containing protein [Candidatus Zipacnadales bacterium]
MRKISDLDRIPVVTAFLHQRGKVLLLRRSGRVGTYQGCWAGVSGYMERVPLEQALVELSEEVNLDETAVQLSSVGAPLRIDDDIQHRHWLVYPFIFTLQRGRNFTLDWESAESRWVQPEELADIETVPGLAEVLSHVWPPFGTPGLWRTARRLTADRIGGATALACECLKALRRLSDGSELRRAACAFAALRPSMGVIPHLMVRFLAAPKEWQALLDELADATRQAATKAAEALYKAERVLTYSASSVCEQALRRWAAHKPTREVIVSESRPMNEGVWLAERLANAGLNVRLVTEAQLGLVIREVDALLVGADAITEENVLLNKVGTAMLVGMAQQAGTATYAVCQTHKITPPGWPVSLERQEPADILPPGMFRVQNTAFDATPLKQFTGIVTEQGELTKKLLDEIRSELAVHSALLLPP